MGKQYFLICGLLILCGLGTVFVNCDTGMGNSPEPGILRVMLQSEPADTSIIIVVDTLSVSLNDNFGVTIFQGKAYNDSLFAILYPDLSSTQQNDIIYNIIKIEDGEYQKYTIFESYVPPGDFNRIQFGLKSSVLKFRGFDEIKVETPDEAKVVDLYHEFSVSEKRATEINVQISPFKSITRFRDSYLFTPIVKIISVTGH